MGEIVNLRKARKKRLIALAESEAAGNRFAHGRRKDERRQAQAERESQKKNIEAHRLEGPSADDGD
jgi:hypothetical protein